MRGAGRQGQRKGTGKKTPEKAAAIQLSPRWEKSATRLQETLQKDSAYQETHHRPSSFFFSSGPKCPTPYLNWEKW